VLFVNLTKPGAEWDGVIDYHVEGSTDEWVEKVESDWRKMRPADWETQATLFDSLGDGVGIKVQKHALVSGAKGAFPPHLFNAHVNKALLGTDTKRDKENIPPPSPAQTPLPPSPSKRRSKHSHYEQPSSPSKKRDVSAVERPVLKGSSTGDVLLQPSAKGKGKDSAGEDPFLVSSCQENSPLDTSGLAWMRRPIEIKAD